MAKKTALVLSGGGFKGAFQVGALQYLKNNWSRIDPSGSPMKFDLQHPSQHRSLAWPGWPLTTPVPVQGL